MLQLKNIVKNYGSKDNVVKALKGISLDFRESEFVSILGQSGCGKTTLLNILGGLDHYTSGDLIINGVSTKKYSDRDWDTYRNHTIGFIFQSYNLIPHLSVLGNVEIALSLTGIGRAERKARAMEALKSVGLASQAKKRPNQLSGGQMQRVAIARALVNNPSVILADEPTGALDSETSVQIMEILKKISDERLIIMVTHNNELAERYSNRIISMLDGQIVNDTNPYTAKSNTVSKQKANDNLSSNKKIKQRKIKKYSSMSFVTSFYLSLKNLLSKKGRTTMTSVAGSIGIIGVALVLAISNGFSGYIDTMQNSALGNSPITVSSITVDLKQFESIDLSDETSSSNNETLKPYDPTSQIIQYGHYNNLTTEFIEHVRAFEEQNKDSGLFNSIEYGYYTPFKAISKYGNGNYILHTSVNSVNPLSGVNNGVFYPLLNNMDYIKTQYELVCGQWPENISGQNYSTDLLLVVEEGNKMPVSILSQLGIVEQLYNATDYSEVLLSDILNTEFKLLYNNDYYTPDSDVYEEITAFEKLDKENQTALQTAFNNASTSLKISGVIKLKEGAVSDLLTAGVVYMPSLKEHYLLDCENSLIAQKQRENTNSFYDPYYLDISMFRKLSFTSVSEINTFLYSSYGYTLNETDAYELGLQQIGISKVPVSISFYPKSFAGKDAFINMLEEYNSNQTNENKKILFSDTTEFLTNTLGQIIDIISYVLIAFAGISLIVSSVMIGVITYASVVERTKEIGVLRSLGARKKDISRVFNAESILVGLCAGVFGIAVSYLLCPIINIIIKGVSNGAVTTNMAVLNPFAGLALIAISTLLTFISGLIPSRLASKKDPVVALRVE